MAATTGKAANCLAVTGVCAVKRTCFTVIGFLPALHHRITAKEVLQGGGESKHLFKYRLQYSYICGQHLPLPKAVSVAQSSEISPLTLLSVALLNCIADRKCRRGYAYTWNGTPRGSTRERQARTSRFTTYW